MGTREEAYKRAELKRLKENLKHARAVHFGMYCASIAIADEAKKQMEKIKEIEKEIEEFGS